MSDVLSDDGHGFGRFCPRDVSAFSLICGQDSEYYDLKCSLTVLVKLREHDAYF